MRFCELPRLLIAMIGGLLLLGWAGAAPVKYAIGSLDRTIKQLRRLNPPVQARRAQRDYIAGLSGRLAPLRPALEAAARDDQAAYERVYRADLSPKILARDASARRCFDDHGYDLGLGTTAP